jgi:FkbM family methyltransferase
MSLWTLSLLRQTWPYLTPASFLRYREYLLRSVDPPSDELLELRLKPAFGGRSLFLRKRGTDPVTFDEVFLKHVYHPVVENLGGCRTLLDLGSNIGLASLYLYGHFRCRCVCVEPNPESFKVLSRNFPDGSATLIHAAVWSRNCLLNTDFKEGRFSTSIVRPSEQGTIPGMPVAELIRRSGFETVDLLKMDVEGAEVEAFKGDHSWIRKVRAIAIEFHSDTRRDTDFDAIMKEYRFHVIDSAHTTLAVREQ